MVPVCDLAEKLTGKRLTSRRFYLISTRQQKSSMDWIAVPVSGECELINADMTPAGPSDSPYVSAWLSYDGSVIEVLNLSALTPGTETTFTAPSITPGEISSGEAQV